MSRRGDGFMGGLRDVFTRTIGDLGGEVQEMSEGSGCLFARGVVPASDEVARGDVVYGGVAMRACDESIVLHPFVFRQICRNGLIVAQSLASRRVETPDWYDEDLIAEEAAEAIRAAACPEAFEEAVLQFRRALGAPADMAREFVPRVSRLPREVVAATIQRVIAELQRGEDLSRFGLVNAVTAVARETQDPALKWRLEEMGWSLLAQPVTVREHAGTFV